MNSSRLDDQLVRMHECCQHALEYVQELQREDFYEDRRTQQAVMMNLMVIGEISAKLIIFFPDFITAHSEIPWNSIRGMRNRIAHGYFDLDLDVVWDTLQIAIPQLRDNLQKLVGDSTQI